MTEKIYFNQQVYRSRSEMPADVREAYDRLNQFFVDNNQDGIPDILQGGKGFGGLKDAFGMIKEISKSAQSGQQIEVDQYTVIRKIGDKIVVNGKEFTRPDEMPDDIRKAYERIIAKSDTKEFGIYDEPWRNTNREEYFKPHDDENINSYPEYDPTIEEVNSNANLLVVFLVVSIAIAVAGAAAWILFVGF